MQESVTLSLETYERMKEQIDELQENKANLNQALIVERSARLEAQKELRAVESAQKKGWF